MIESGNNQLVCEGAILEDLVATVSGSVAGDVSYYWYLSDGSGDTQVGTGLSLALGEISQSGMYSYYDVLKMNNLMHLNKEKVLNAAYFHAKSNRKEVIIS